MPKLTIRTICLVRTGHNHRKALLLLMNIYGELGQFAVYYISPQSFTVTLSYLLAYQLSGL